MEHFALRSYYITHCHGSNFDGNSLQIFPPFEEADVAQDGSYPLPPNSEVISAYRKSSSDVEHFADDDVGVLRMCYQKLAVQGDVYIAKEAAHRLLSRFFKITE
jgi:hypothetical protein